MATTTPTPARILPADVYDALELSVLASGCRIVAGAGRLTCGGPGCLLAHAAFLDGALIGDGDPEFSDVDWGWQTIPNADTPVLAAVWQAFGARTVADVFAHNDSACDAAPLTWTQYTRQLNIIRGDH